VVVLSIYNVIVPPNSKKLLKFLRSLVIFDIFYEFYDPNDHLPFSETPAFSENFCQADFCSLGFFDALGSIAVLIILGLILWLVAHTIRFIAAKTGCDRWKYCKSIREREGMFSEG